MANLQHAAGQVGDWLGGRVRVAGAGTKVCCAGVMGTWMSQPRFCLLSRYIGCRVVVVVFSKCRNLYSVRHGPWLVYSRVFDK